MGRTDKSSARNVFICQQCGRESLKWLGHCPDCGEWNTFTETTVSTTPSRPGRTASSPPAELVHVSLESAPRHTLNGMAELGRVLGGGLVAGSMVLLSGEPGIGKSTLLLQAAAAVCSNSGKVVYASGEETQQQIKLRAKRLGITGEGLFLLPETCLENILDQIAPIAPELVILDSIQTIYTQGVDTSPGSISQVRESTIRLMQWAKSQNIPVLIAGHVTKDGTIAGPRVLEHIVDVVLYLEGESF
ncbi:AAA family ATPase, partial [Chloroflexota bacterium]